MSNNPLNSGIGDGLDELVRNEKLRVAADREPRSGAERCSLQCDRKVYMTVSSNVDARTAAMARELREEYQIIIAALVRPAVTKAIRDRYAIENQHLRRHRGG
jgi:hypothetical protein